MGTLNMNRKRNNDKSKKSSYSPVVSKHQCSMEILYLEPGDKKQILKEFCIFQNEIILPHMKVPSLSLILFGIPTIPFFRNQHQISNFPLMLYIQVKILDNL